MSDKNKSNNPLIVIVSVAAIALVVWNIYSGAKLKKIGIPWLFEIELEPAKVREYEKFDNHNFKSGLIENGYRCEKNTDCKPSPNQGHCYPGPPNNQIKYCINRDLNCAFPGTSGVNWGIYEFKNKKYECYDAGTGQQARWKPAN